MHNVKLYLAFFSSSNENKLMVWSIGDHISQNMYAVLILIYFSILNQSNVLTTGQEWVTYLTLSAF